MPIVAPTLRVRSLGDLKGRIADELARSDLTAQIALAIEEAISEAAMNRFWFNEVRGLNFGIAAGQEWVGNDDLAMMTEIDDVWITVNGQRRNLRPIGDKELDDLAQGSESTGEPYRWSRYGLGIRFYPVPRQVYYVTVDGVSSLQQLDFDTDSNAWTNEGERYVRALAKRELYANIIRDSDEAQTQDALAARYREELMSATYDRLATGRMACNG